MSSDLRDRGRPWGRTVLAAYERDGWVCQRCTRPVHLTRTCVRGGCDLCAHGDHVVGVAAARALGWGRAQVNDLGNVLTSCRRCNLSRSGRQRSHARRLRRIGRNGSARGDFSVTSNFEDPTCSASPPSHFAGPVNAW